MIARADRLIGRRIGPTAAALLLMAAMPFMSPRQHEATAREDVAPRKVHHSQPARTGQAAPDRTGSIAKVIPTRTPIAASLPVSAPSQAREADETPLVPITLPAVPRSRMIACGEVWRTMKMNGTTGDDSWREFALKCLVAKGAP